MWHHPPHQIPPPEVMVGPSAGHVVVLPPGAVYGSVPAGARLMPSEPYIEREPMRYIPAPNERYVVGPPEFVGPGYPAHHPRRRERSRSRGRERYKIEETGKQQTYERRVTRAVHDPLTHWGEWRTQMNESLSHDLTQNTYNPINTGEDFDELITSKQRGVYRYSSAPDNGTSLQKLDYVAFGIPRAQTNGVVRANGYPQPRRENYEPKASSHRRDRESSSHRQRRDRSPSASSLDESEDSRRELNLPYYIITKIKDHKSREKMGEHMQPEYHASYN